MWTIQKISQFQLGPGISINCSAGPGSNLEHSRRQPVQASGSRADPACVPPDFATLAADAHPPLRRAPRRLGAPLVHVGPLCLRARPALGSSTYSSEDVCPAGCT